MANFFSTEVTSLNAAPPVKVKVNRLNGRLRYAFGQFTNPASSGAGIADIIYFTRIPRGGRILGWMSSVSWSTGTASSTMNLGDSVTAARHLAATAITTAGNATPQVVTSSNGVAGYEVTDETRDGTGVPTSTNDSDLRGTVAGAVVAASQIIATHMVYVQD